MQDDWADADATARRVLAENGGVARIDAFLRAGLTRHQVAAIFRRGVIERPRYAWYVDPNLQWRAKCAIRVGGVLGCVSALDSFGLPIPPEAHRCTHVQVPGNAPRLRHARDRDRYVTPQENPEVVVHWAVRDGQQVGWRTSVVESLVQAADCAPLEWWIAALDAGLHRPRQGAALLLEEDLGALRRRLPDRLLPALDLVDPRAESCIETLLRLALLRRGLGPLLLQFAPHPAYRVDFLLRGRLIVEADGEAFHEPERDRVRDAHLRGLGYHVLRFTYREITGDVERVVDTIEAALAAL